MLFLGASDTLVRIATGLSLRRALGEPETYLLSGNHDTASLCFGFILRAADEFLWKEAGPGLPPSGSAGEEIAELPRHAAECLAVGHLEG